MRLLILIITALEAIFLAMGLILTLKGAKNVQLTRGKIRNQVITLCLTLILLIIPAMLLAYYFAYLWLAFAMSLLAFVLIVRALWRV